VNEGLFDPKLPILNENNIYKFDIRVFMKRVAQIFIRMRIVWATLALVDLLNSLASLGARRGEVDFTGAAAGDPGVPQASKALNIGVVQLEWTI